jgi:GT2 family glycosyltransferase
MKTTVVIPLYGGEDDLSECLVSLQRCKDLVAEVVVVDNASPDNAAEVALSFENVTLVKVGVNSGFSAACNRGFRYCQTETVLFLNSDTLVPSHGLRELLSTLDSDKRIAIAGPYTNYSGYHQQIDERPNGLDDLEAFADAFAKQSRPDLDVDMLTGFCMAIRSDWFEAVDGFDEKFGVGTWEDNDICYRCIREQRRLVLAAKSFIFHYGSRSFGRSKEDANAVFNKNRSYFIHKWQKDIRDGFASGLPGLCSDPIVFNRAKSNANR